MPDTPPQVASRPVLVLDADQPSALAIVRSLARCGLTVHVAAAQDQALAGYSRHAAHRLRYPDPLRAEADFIDWLDNLLRSQRYMPVIPVTERCLVPMLRHRDRLQDQAIAMAPSAALEQALDKDRTLQLAQSLGIPVPRSVAVTGLDQLPAAAAALGYPVVVKPARSVGQDATQRVQLSVSYAHGDAELQAQVRHALRYGAVILQEYFRGDGVGIELIAAQGVVRHAFQHKRLHEVPLTGGGSSLRVSEAVTPALLQASRQLMQAMGWHGVAMVEFKHQPATGEFRLMEINGRFWGSLPLAVAAGADFPAMLHELMTTGQVAERAPARVGVVCRQLARDIDWIEHVLRRAAPPQLVRLPSRGEVLRDSLLVLSPRHHFDVQTWRDPLPGLVDLGRIARRQWQRLGGALQQRRRLAREWRAGQPGGAGPRRLAESRRVLFLCYGNINRSALAQAHAQLRHGERFELLSAGFHAVAGRPVDPQMVEVAAARGLDLQGRQSCTLSAAMVAQADLILAMEAAHLDRLLREHPAAQGKAFLLGAASARSRHQTEVADPYGQPRAVYEQVFGQVTTAVDAWLATPAARPAAAAPAPTTATTPTTQPDPAPDMSFLTALANNPALVLRHRNIFLLSHMRANTSLFGHLLGSHPQVEGYYEMHIGYHSWKSLWRQKLRHFASHDAKPGARYMFDKVLHDGHAVALPLLQRADSRCILMLREPVQSIKSLVVLYRGTSPQLPEATPEGAARYYIDRLATLAQLAPALQQRFFYLDAECLVQDTAPTLAALGSWLALDTPIPTEYQTFSNTGRGNSGDTSSRLKSGKVSRSSNDYSQIEVPAALMDEAVQAYQRHRATLLAHSQRSSTLAQPLAGAAV